MFALLYNLYQFLKEKYERKITIVLLGLDNAGKTTLLNTLNGEPDKETTPTFGFSSINASAAELALGGKNCILQIFDLGGGKNIRRVWKSYLAEVHGVVFVVDAADQDRFEECKQVLQETIELRHLHGKPIAVFANKQDLKQSASASEVAKQLGLTEYKLNDFNIAACVAKPEPGQASDRRIHEGMRWLLSSIGRDFSKLDARVQKDAEEVKQEDMRRKKEREERVRKLKEERMRAQQEEEQKELKSGHAISEAIPPLPLGMIPVSTRENLPGTNPEPSRAKEDQNIHRLDTQKLAPDSDLGDSARQCLQQGALATTQCSLYAKAIPESPPSSRPASAKQASLQSSKSSSVRSSFNHGWIKAHASLNNSDLVSETEGCGSQRTSTLKHNQVAPA